METQFHPTTSTTTTHTIIIINKYEAKEREKVQALLDNGLISKYINTLKNIKETKDPSRMGKELTLSQENIKIHKAIGKCVTYH